MNMGSNKSSTNRPFLTCQLQRTLTAELPSALHLNLLTWLTKQVLRGQYCIPGKCTRYFSFRVCSGGHRNHILDQWCSYLRWRLLFPSLSLSTLSCSTYALMAAGCDGAQLWYYWFWMTAVIFTLNWGCYGWWMEQIAWWFWLVIMMAVVVVGYLVSVGCQCGRLSIWITYERTLS